MELTELIRHPETMTKETLYDLRSLLALHPYYQPARLLMLQNLYLLHDTTFDEELRRAAIYMQDRTKLFELVEAAHYQTRPNKKAEPAEAAATPSAREANRTLSLIDNFLDSIPKEEPAEGNTGRKPTAIDATIDYVAYLLNTEGDTPTAEQPAPELKGQSLIDNFINNENGKIKLPEDNTPVPATETPTDETAENDNEEGYFTETLAKIYIKQGRFEKALEIIQRLNLIYPKKNVYFADQIRFLEKLVLNSKTN